MADKKTEQTNAVPAGPEAEGELGRPSRRRARLVLALVSGVVALLLGELICRLLLSDEMMGNVRHHPTMSYHVSEGYRLIPNSEQDEVRINSRGYRDREFSLEPPSGTKRILMLGDSVVFGPGVELAETFSKRTEALLRETGAGDVEVINAGNPDTGLTEMLQIFRDRDSGVRPQLAVLCFYLNDSRPPMGFRSEFVKGNPVVRFMKRNPWVRRSMLVSFGYYVYFNSAIREEVAKLPDGSATSEEDAPLPICLRMEWTELFQSGVWRENPAALNRTIEAAQFDWGAAWRPETWPEVAARLRDFEDLCREHDCRIALAAMPVSVQVHGSVIRDEPQKRLAEIAHEMGWPFLDVLPGLRAAKDGPPLFGDHCHLTPRGHDLVAQMMVEFLDAAEFREFWDGQGE